MMTRRQDVVPNPDFLVHFYLVMHIGLTNKDQVKMWLFCFWKLNDIAEAHFLTYLIQAD